MALHQATAAHVPFPPPASLTPGAYMRQCREHAGKSVEQCAGELALQAHDRRFAQEDIARLEADRAGDFYRLARMLKDRAVFAFDMGTFLTLAAATCAPELGEWDEI